MSLIPSVTLEKLQGLGEAEIKDLPSVEILNEDGEYIATLIVPGMHGGYPVFDNIKTKAEYLGVQGNSVHPTGKVKEENTCPECGFEAKSEFGLQSHMRKHYATV